MFGQLSHLHLPRGPGSLEMLRENFFVSLHGFQVLANLSKVLMSLFIITHAPTVDALWHSPREAKVANFHLTVPVYQNVFWLDIAVHDI